MNILIVGNLGSQAEFKSKFGGKHSCLFKNYLELERKEVLSAEVIFDFQIVEHPDHGTIYLENSDALLVLNSVKTTLVKLKKMYGWKNNLVGFNGLPGMFDKPMLELTIAGSSKKLVENLCLQMSTDYRIVEDKIGMVTPRVVSMIINEAYYTVEEGTATIEDINVAMKLGTNYPAGPFEMANSIGITHIYELLKALSGSTGDERYKICSLLKKHSYSQK